MLEAHFCERSLEDLKDYGITEADRELFKNKYGVEPEHLVLGIIEESTNTTTDENIKQFNVQLDKLPKNKLLFSHHRFFTKSNDKIKQYLFIDEHMTIPLVSAIVIDYEDLVRLVKDDNK